MAVFNVPVVIGVDEEKIVREIEKDVKNQCVKGIQEKVEDIIFEKPDYYNHRSDHPLRNMVKEEILNFIASKEDIIIERTAELLSDRLIRTKRVKEKVDQVLKETLEESDEK